MHVEEGAEMGTWWRLKRPGLMNPGDGAPGAQDYWCEGKSPEVMAEHSSLTFFLAPSLTIAQAVWVPEGLCLLALMGFSKEQLRVSTHLSVLMSLLLQVMWSWFHPGCGHGLGCAWV